MAQVDKLEAHYSYDWINKAFAYSGMILSNTEWCNAIKENKIQNPIEFSEYVLKINELSDLSPRLFYKKVLCNEAVVDYKIMQKVIEILSVSLNREYTLLNINDLLKRYNEDGDYYLFIKRNFQDNRRTNTFWSKSRIAQENKLYYLNGYINYRGKLILPKGVSLMCSRREFELEGRKLHHCIGNYWDEAKDRQCFVLKGRKKENYTCIVRKSAYMPWFEIAEINGDSNTKVSAEVVMQLSSYLVKEENQHFFWKNKSILNHEEYEDVNTGESIFLDFDKALFLSLTVDDMCFDKEMDLKLTLDSELLKGDVSEVKAKALFRGKSFLLEVPMSYFLSKVDIDILLNKYEDLQADELRVKHKNMLLSIESQYVEIRSKVVKECFDNLSSFRKDKSIDYSYDNLEMLIDKYECFFAEAGQSSIDDYLNEICNKSLIAKHLRDNGYFVVKRSDSKRKSYKMFLARLLGISELTSDETLFALLKQKLAEPMFPSCDAWLSY